ncbi:50S ribosomal protein L18 [[Mycoplasma] mobile]|uniref:Large ribosomal subunit protein uL18 n=1 Tax=Mycoplasma mobile (strain ATCC 43663 / 163K / NCTC 11711) TaxID=267748 RepID=RL18_MYCM1|nr:50S ribosomal protein L18 [[Mycoplasma] mobile]Q6KI39.1 RecName: Full=Large ribosomal subunit protein uL18; AltName: Full=50S ribosomal protein L18 [Mycoplasma mobile 163K]AAT27737.1 50S ribosomal protein l18 [Mycoplasma mobile 163K]
MAKLLSRNDARKAKHLRIRNKIRKTTNLPRVFVYKSLQNFYAQLFDDKLNKTIVSLGTSKNKEYSGNIAAAKKLGHEMGALLKTKKIDKIVFDRSGYIYHGRVKAFAEAMREEGVKF